MPCLIGNSGPSGPLIKVQIAPPGKFTDTDAKAGKIKTFSGLIDTGATYTCVTESVANEMGLQATGKTQVKSASHTVICNTFIADIFVPFPLALFTYHLKSWQVIEFKENSTDYQFLIGRDLLNHGTLNICPDGHFVFCL